MGPRRIRAVLLVLLLAVSPVAPAAGAGYPVELASRMMELMWDAMLWFFTGVERPLTPGWGGTPGGGWGTAYWSGLHGAWGAPSPPAGGYGPTAGLDGFWVNPRGERLTVHQGRFAYEAGGRRLDGWLAVQGERIVARNPAVGLNQLFAYRREGNRLLVVSPDGQLFPFVRWQPGFGYR